MQLAGFVDYLEAPQRGRLARSLSGLGQSSPNPYPNGVSVSGGGSAAPWSVAWYPALNVWVANTGFGFAPIYTPEQFPSIAVSTDAGSFQATAHIPGTPAEQWMDPRLSSTRDSLTPQNSPDSASVTLESSKVASSLGPGSSLVIQTPDGGSQVVDYRWDGTYWAPTAVQGFGKPGTSWFDTMIEAGAIIGATIATAGTAAGFATGPGPGAAAIGGSADVAAGSAAAVAAPVAVAAPAVTEAPAAATAVPDVASTTAPEILNFTPAPLAPQPVLDVSASVPINITSATTSAAAAATNPLTQIFSLSKYIQTLAGAYKTVAGLSSGSHPQSGQTVRLPDGSVQRVNPDGSATIIQPSGNQTTVGAGGTVTTSAPGAGAGLAVAAIALALFTS